MKKNLLSDGFIKEFYIEISEIIRRYIEGRFFIPALEETSGEILRELMNQDIDKEIQYKVKEILESSDLVKFAKHKPTSKENNKVINLSKEFIEATMVIYEIEEKSEIAETEDLNQLEAEKEISDVENKSIP
jgi:hypothetical protein